VSVALATIAGVTVVLALLSTNSCNTTSLVSSLNSLRGDPYPLDSQPRNVGSDAGLECPEVELELYVGEMVRFTPPVEIVPAFAERLRRFERVLHDVALSHYGRSPLQVLNAGGHFCRTVRHRPERLSEHALGNAIDIVGFAFGRDQSASDAGAQPALDPERLSALEKPFEVTVQEHWKGAGTELSQRHERFLHALTRRLSEQDVFRTLLGPAHPTHATHFHFDMAPWSYEKL
jgi:hypothetical protein